MEGLLVVHYSNLVPEASGFDLNLRTVNCDKSCAKDERSTSNNMIENVENTLHQDSSCCSVLNKDNIVDEEVGIDDFFHFQNSHSTGSNWTFEEDKTSIIEEISVCKELIPFDTTLKKCLRKFATFPSSETEASLLSYLERDGPSTSTTVPIQNSSGDQLPTYKRSTSLPASSELISAMKGGRAHKGTLPRNYMRVKWAVEVYDPPSTLMSHTVKNHHHQRPKSNKKDKHKNKKHNKGKNSRGNSNGKKLSNGGNVGGLAIPIPAKYAPPSPWLQDGGASGSAQSESGGKSAIEILEFAVGGIQDVNCGNNTFLRESLAKLHLSVGEAT